MGDMMRSDKMELCDIYIQPDVAFDAMCKLGEMGCCQFIDINQHTPLPKRAYVSEVCRCEEIERKLSYMELEMKKDAIIIPEIVGPDPKPMTMSEVSQHEPQLDKWENDVIEMAKNQTTLMKNYLELVEMYYVLDHIGPVLGNAHVQFTSKNLRRDLPDGRLVVFTGVLERSKCFGFETMLWRMSHGNILYKQADLDQLIVEAGNTTGTWKVAFLVICQGENLARRVQKVCEGYHANLYGCPETPDERADALNLLEIRISDLGQYNEASEAGSSSQVQVAPPVTNNGNKKRSLLENQSSQSVLEKTFTAEKPTFAPPEPKRSKLSQLSEMINDLKYMRDDDTPATKEETEFEVFGKSVGSQLNKLSEEQAVTAQGQIQNIITECRLADIRANNARSTTQSYQQDEYTQWDPTQVSNPEPSPTTSSSSCGFKSVEEYSPVTPDDQNSQDNIINNAFLNA